jgi:hypothetical protein
MVGNDSTDNSNKAGTDHLENPGREISRCTGLSRTTMRNYLKTDIVAPS